jgi:hypothetical protein
MAERAPGLDFVDLQPSTTATVVADHRRNDLERPRGHATGADADLRRRDVEARALLDRIAAADPRMTELSPDQFELVHRGGGRWRLTGNCQ